MSKFAVLFLMVVSGSFQTIASDPQLIKRSTWGAKAAKSVNVLPVNPPPYVVVHHSETPICGNVEKCSQRVKNIQHHHTNIRGWSDIGYNFLIGGDGNVYEGRGWGVQGAHAPRYNEKSIGICLIGNFTDIAPSTSQLESLNQLISYGVKNNKIVGDYHLVGHRQVRATDCPGDELYEKVKAMPHWEPHPN